MTRFLLGASLALLLVLPARAQSQGSVHEELARIVRAAVVSDTELSSNLLEGLRALHDPTLRPLFGILAGSWREDLRYQGILGLAELSPERRVNALMIAGLERPTEQARILDEAFKRDLIGADQIHEILAWPVLEPGFEVFIRARMYALTGDLNIDRLEEIVRGDDDAAGALASVLLCETGDGVWSEQAIARLEALPGAQRIRVAEFALIMVARERLVRCVGVVRAIGAWDDPGFTIRSGVVHAMLVISPAEGAAAWRDLFVDEDDLASRIRLLLVAMRSEYAFSEADVELVRAADNRSLLVDMALAMSAWNSGRDIEQAFVRLARHAHAPSCRWMTGRASLLEAPDATGLLLRLASIYLDAAADDERFEEVATQALEIIAGLDPAAPGAVADLTDASRTAMMLTATIRAGVPPAWAPDPTDWPDRTCAALASLARARAMPLEALTEEHVGELQEIARGWGTLPADSRVQAAWIALRAVRRDRELLARILSPPPLTDD